jgi:hypothetical protein
MNWSRPGAGSQMAHQKKTGRPKAGIRVVVPDSLVPGGVVPDSLVSDGLEDTLQHLAALLFQGVGRMLWFASIQPSYMPGHMPPQIAYRSGLHID